MNTRPITVIRRPSLRHIGMLAAAILILLLAGFLRFGVTSTVASGFSGWDRTDTIVLVSADPDDPFVPEAASELQSYLGQISNRSWTISTTDVPDPAIRLLVDPGSAQLQGRNVEAFHLKVDNTGITITGASPIAVRHGAYALLEKLGTRWFFKNPVWEDVPGSLVDIPETDEVIEPAYIYRRIWHPVSGGLDEWREWRKKNRMGGASTYEIGHNFEQIIPFSEFDTDPEYFCPVGGPPRQLNPSNPEVVARAIEFARRELALPPTSQWDSADDLPRGLAAIVPNDGLGWCWDESDWQYTADQVYTLVNTVAKDVSVDFPDKLIGTYSYSLYSGLPSFDLEPNVLIQVATNYNKSPYSIQERIDGLTARGAKLGIRDYYDVWVWYHDQPPADFYDLLENINKYSQSGAIVINAEAGDGWGARGLLYYVASRLYWDPQADVQEILADFYTRAFGPAASSMQRYFERWNSRQPVNERTIGLAFRDLDEAESFAAGNPVILERIRHIQYYVRYLWFWERYSAGALTLEETKDFYSFACRIDSTYMVWNRYLQPNLQRALRDLGLLDEEITALCDKTLPSAQEARTWMDEALTQLVNPGLVEVPNVDPYGFALEPLGAEKAGDAPKLPLFRTRQSKIFVQANAGESVTVEFEAEWGRMLWRRPDEQILEERIYEAPTGVTQTTFAAPVSGTYRLDIIKGSDITLIDIPGYPAGMLARPNGENQWTESPWWVPGAEVYFYVPEGTPSLAVGVAGGRPDRLGTITLYDPSGATALVGSFGDNPTTEWTIVNPQSGVWRIDGFQPGIGANFWLMGILPFVWNDPEQLLVISETQPPKPTPTPIPTPLPVPTATPVPATPTPVPGSTPSPTPVSTPEWVTQGLVSLYEFDEGSGTSVSDTSGVGAPLDLTIRNAANVTWLDGGLRLNASTSIDSILPADKISNAAKASGEITVEAWLRPGNTTQNGPARIASISNGSLVRNVTLGQAGDAYISRLRTTATSLNGIPQLASPAGVIVNEKQHVVYTRSTDGAASIYVDGSLVATSSVAGNLDSWDGAYRLVLANEFGPNRSWLGDLYLVAFYTRALTASEVAQNFAAGEARSGQGSPVSTPTAVPSSPTPVPTPTATATPVTVSQPPSFGGGVAAPPPQPTAIPASSLTKPSAPRNAVATAGDGQVTLTWNVPAWNGGIPITQYRVLIIPTGSVILTNDATTTIDITGLTNGVTYRFQVAALNSLGQGDSILTAAVTPVFEEVQTPTPEPTVLPDPVPVPTPTPTPIVFGAPTDPNPDPEPTPTATATATAVPQPAATPQATATPTTNNKTQVIELMKGWNLISFNVALESPGIRSTLSSVEGLYTQVYTLTANEVQVFSPDRPEFLNSLLEFEIGRAYWVNMSAAASLTVEGKSISPSTPINLHAGWNMVAYLPETDMPVQLALATIDGKYDEVRAFDSEAMTYISDIPAEFNSLNSMETSMGYLIHMNEDGVLVYQ